MTVAEEIEKLEKAQKKVGAKMLANPQGRKERREWSRIFERLTQLRQAGEKKRRVKSLREQYEAAANAWLNAQAVWLKTPKNRDEAAAKKAMKAAVKADELRGKLLAAGGKRRVVAAARSSRKQVFSAAAKREFLVVRRLLRGS